jgi:hypothetical protein
MKLRTKREEIGTYKFLNSPETAKNLQKLTNTGQFLEVYFGAAIQIRTGDLILTKDALYQLSYSSKWRPGSGSN